LISRQAGAGYVAIVDGIETTAEAMVQAHARFLMVEKPSIHSSADPFVAEGIAGSASMCS